MFLKAKTMQLLSDGIIIVIFFIHTYIFFQKVIHELFNLFEDETNLTANTSPCPSSLHVHTHTWG